MVDCFCVNYSLDSKKLIFFYSFYKIRIGLENYEKSIKFENEFLKYFNKIKEMRMFNIKF